MSVMYTKEEYKQNLNAVVLDLETTGLAAKTDRIIEIGSITICQGKLKGEYSQLLDPGFMLQERTVQITGITDEMLSGKPEFKQVKEKLLSFIGEDVLIGHNILFDFSFLKKAVINDSPKGTRFERLGIDTLKIARMVLPGEQKKTLEALCQLYGIEYQPHRALEDALATWELFQVLVDQYYETAPELFKPKPLNYQVKRDTPVMQKQIEQIRRLHEQYQIPLTRDLSKMTKSEASRYIDQMKAEYGKN